MSYKYKLYVFDFDGTLTKRDSFIEFIRYVRGDRAAFLGLLRFSPLLLLMKLGIADSGKVKEAMFSHFFAGMEEKIFNCWCAKFAHNKRSLLRPKGEEKLKAVLTEGGRVLVVSASITRWVGRFFDEMSANYPESQFKVIGTEISVQNGVLTGRFSTKNCRGEEKVRRVRELHPNRADCWLVSFGDSKGDIPLLNFSDERHYKPFRK